MNEDCQNDQQHGKSNSKEVSGQIVVVHRQVLKRNCFDDNVVKHRFHNSFCFISFMALIVPNHISYCGCIRISYYHQAQQTVLMAYVLFLDSSNVPVNIHIAKFMYVYIFIYLVLSNISLSFFREAASRIFVAVRSLFTLVGNSVLLY